MIQEKLYYKSDFKVFIRNDAGWETPFSIRFYTGSPLRCLSASYNGFVYTNCSITEDGLLRVAFDEANPVGRERMGLGVLQMEPTFYLTDKDYADGIANEALPPQILTFENSAGESVEVLLSLQGATDLDIKCELLKDLNGDYSDFRDKVGAVFFDATTSSSLTVYLFRSLADKTTWLANQSNTDLVLSSQTFSISSDPTSVLAEAKAYADSILKNYDDEIAAINLKINTANEVLESLL